MFEVFPDTKNLVYYVNMRCNDVNYVIYVIKMDTVL